MFLREDGGLIEGSNDDIFIAGFNYAPTWESPQLVTIFELVSGDKWQRKAKLATESFFGLNRAEQNWKEGATHWQGGKFNPSASIWNEQGIFNFSASNDLCRNETEWHCLSDISDFVAPAARASVASYFRQIKTPDLFYVSFEQVNTAIVFNTISGDTLHAVLPLLFCKNNCIQQLPLNIGARPGIEQVSLLAAFPYLLVVDDHNTNGNNPNVIDLRTGKIVFKSSGGGNVDDCSLMTASEVVDVTKIFGKVKESRLASSTTSKIPAKGTDYVHGERTATLEEGEQLARRRQEMYDCQRETYIAETNCRGMSAGTTFTVSGNPQDDYNGDYLVLSVSHKGDQSQAFTFGGGHTAASTGKKKWPRKFGQPVKW